MADPESILLQGSAKARTDDMVSVLNANGNALSPERGACVGFNGVGGVEHDAKSRPEG